MDPEAFDTGDLEMPEGEALDNSSWAPQKVGEEKDITPDGGVKKLLVKEGEGYDQPEAGDEVQVHYTGKLLDGTVFDSSRTRDAPFTFKLGQGQVIKGWDKGVATMKKGEQAVLTCAPEYAYGDKGAGKDIPPNATLKFDVELLSWKSVKDITGDGGVLKKVLTEGSGWETPKQPDQVTVKYEVKLQDGTVLDISPEDGVEFYVKEGYLVPAISKAVTTMKKGEKVQLTVKPQYGFGESGKGLKQQVPPNATVLIDLELMSWKSVEKVTEDSKVMKKTLKAGEGYDKPNDGATVKVRYEVRLLDGTVVERVEGEGREFMVGEEQVMQGLDEAVQKMKKGERALLTVAPEYAYGDTEVVKEGLLAPVPGGSTVEVEVEVAEFVKEKESWDMKDAAEKLAAAGQKKEEGNRLFKEGKYLRASKKYEKAVKYIEYDTAFSDEEKKQAKVLKESCRLNKAACQLKLKNWKEAASLCSKVLETDSGSVKARYRRAQAYMQTDDFDLAEADIKKALELDPKNKDVRAELKVLKTKMAEYNKVTAKFYGNMFERLSKLEKKESQQGQAQNGTAMEVDASNHKEQ